MCLCVCMSHTHSGAEDLSSEEEHVSCPQYVSSQHVSSHQQHVSSHQHVSSQQHAHMHNHHPSAPATASTELQDIFWRVHMCCERLYKGSVKALVFSRDRIRWIGWFDTCYTMYCWTDMIMCTVGCTKGIQHSVVSSPSSGTEVAHEGIMRGGRETVMPGLYICQACYQFGCQAASLFRLLLCLRLVQGYAKQCSLFLNSKKCQVGVDPVRVYPVIFLVQAVSPVTRFFLVLDWAKWWYSDHLHEQLMVFRFKHVMKMWWSKRQLFV